MPNFIKDLFLDYKIEFKSSEIFQVYFIYSKATIRIFLSVKLLLMLIKYHEI